MTLSYLIDPGSLMRLVGTRILVLSPVVPTWRWRTATHKIKNDTNSTGTIRRNKISDPVELLSSTNILAYVAPDLHQNPLPPRSLDPTHG